jgi:metal-responsive CopG/Arc/MetJ family transcriptional regulator
MPYLLEEVKMATETMKLTISLPKNLAIFADEMAREKNVTRSKIISMCLEDERRRQKVELMKEGYLVMAHEHSEFAELAEELASEIVPTWE